MGRLLRALKDPGKIRVFLKSKATQLRVRLKYLSLGNKGQEDLRVFPVIWIRTPKCASSSILASLELVDRVANVTKNPDLPLTEQVLRRKVICVGAGDKERFMEQYPDVWSDAFKWAVVRNPYDRAVSAWRYLEALRNRPLEEVLADPPTRDGALHEYNHFARPYSSMLNVSGVLDVDEVLKFESLDVALPALFNKLGVPFVGLAHVNQTPGAKPKESAVSDVAREKIRQMFTDDFESFGYVE